MRYIGFVSTDYADVAIERYKLGFSERIIIKGDPRMPNGSNIDPKSMVGLYEVEPGVPAHGTVFQVMNPSPCSECGCRHINIVVSTAGDHFLVCQGCMNTQMIMVKGR